MEQQIVSKKPQGSSYAGTKPVKLLTNYYAFKFMNPKKNIIFKYSVKFNPEIPDNSRKVRNKIINGARKNLEQFLGFFIFMGSCIYSLENCQDIQPLASEYDGTNYEIQVNWVQAISDKDVDKLVFMKVFFNSLLKKIKFKQIGRNFFNPNQSKSLTQFNIELWPGFSSSLAVLQKGVLLNVDICHKVLRTDSVLDLIQEIKGRCRGDAKDEIKKALIGTTVLTIYNKRTYKVDGIDFDRCPNDCFSQGDNGPTITYAEYFKHKYGREIQETGQPVIININQKTGNKIILIPELCQMTGLSDSMRANFQLMKEMAQITNADAKRRVEECKSLLEMFKLNEKCRQEMDHWQVEIADCPQEISGFKLQAGNLLMGPTNNGNRVSFDLENTPDIDRKIQTQMYDQPPLLKWGIFYCEFDKKTAQIFMDTLQKCCDSFNYKVSKPREFSIKSNRYNDWESCIRQNINNQVQAIVLILPGQKGKAPLYDDLKRLLLSKIPCPSQVVLAGTISKGKNVRSICNKILIQICAKVGGEPWAINELPYFDKPTMVCGMDVYHKVGNGTNSILAFTASINQRGTKFWSSAKIQDEGQEISNVLESLMTDALTEFRRKNNRDPEHLIIYRDGVGDSQRNTVLQYELPQIQNAVEKLGMSKTTKIMLLLVNKRVSQRFFNEEPQSGRLSNPLPGTIIDEGIIPVGANEFYLVSQIAKVGVVSPTHYIVLYDTIKEDPKKIQMLTYKMCFTYYNVSGSIKVPAPIQYAHRLANLIGDRAKGSSRDLVPLPHEYFAKSLQSLYFI